MQTVTDHRRRLPKAGLIAWLEQQSALDRLAGPLQSLARSVPAPVRNVLHGVWLGHPLHPVLVQVPVGSWLSATLLDARGSAGTSGGSGRSGAGGTRTADREKATRWLTWLGLATAGPAAAAGAADWAELHEQQVRVGVVHAVTNWLAIGCFGMSLACNSAAARRTLRLAGLTALGASGLLGGHLAYRQAAGANHAESVPHLVEAGWHYLMTEADLPDDGKPVRQLIGEIPVVVVRQRGAVHVLADRCSHLSGPLSDGEVTDGQLTCPWHGSTFRLADGSVARGPATAPQPRFETRVVGGAIQVRLPGADG